MLKNKNTTKTLIGMLLIILSVTVLTGCKKKENTPTIPNYEVPIKNHIESLQEGNAEKMLAAYPQFFVDILKEEYSDEQINEIAKQMQNVYGDNLTISYEILDKTEIEKDQLKIYKEDIKLNFDKDINVTAGYKINVKLTFKGSKAESTTQEQMKVYEIDGKWSLLD